MSIFILEVLNFGKGESTGTAKPKVIRSVGYRHRHREKQPSDESIEYFVFLHRIHMLNGLKQGIVTRPEDGCGQQERRDNACCLVADTLNTDSLCRPVFCPENGNVGIGGRLKNGQTNTYQKQTAKKKTVRANLSGRDKNKGARGHYPKTQHHPFFKSNFFQQE